MKAIKKLPSSYLLHERKKSGLPGRFGSYYWPQKSRLDVPPLSIVGLM